MLHPTSFLPGFSSRTGASRSGSTPPPSSPIAPLQALWGEWLQPIIEQAIRKQMHAYSNRLAFLLVRSSFVSEQTRSLATNILNHLPGITQVMVHDILNKSSDTAKRNITRRSPQLETVLKEVEHWMQQEGETT